MDLVIFTEWSRFSAKYNDVPPITELEKFTVECRCLMDRVDKTKTTSRQQPTPLQQQSLYSKVIPVMAAPAGGKSCLACRIPSDSEEEEIEAMETMQ